MLHPRHTSLSLYPKTYSQQLPNICRQQKAVIGLTKEYDSDGKLAPRLDLQVGSFRRRATADEEKGKRKKQSLT